VRYNIGVKPILILVALATVAHADPTVPVLPPIDQVAAIALQQKQGGPAQLRCDGIVYEATIDLKANTWTGAWCVMPPGKQPSNGKRTPTSGKLAADLRTRIVDAYGKLTAKIAPGCGNDGGTLTLTITKTDKSTIQLVDENWGCKKPPPVIAVGLHDLANVAATPTAPH
jgi:hypothetical protein